MSYHCGKTLPEVFQYFHTKQKDIDTITKILLSEGYTPTGICYAASRAEEKLLTFVGDSHFTSIFINEVRKNALKPGDPRWNKRKEN